jgi:hypothetical protein
VRTNQFIRGQGIVLIDTHHGETLIEIHPYDPIVALGATGQWVAIAGNEKLRWGWAQGRPSEADAKAEALKHCGQTDCKIVLSAQGRCFAIAESKPSGSPWAVNIDSEIGKAQIAAQRTCAEKAPGTCKGVHADCFWGQ